MTNYQGICYINCPPEALVLHPGLLGLGPELLGLDHELPGLDPVLQGLDPGLEPSIGTLSQSRVSEE